MSVTKAQLIDALDAFAPLRLQDDYDNAGLQVGLKDDVITSVLVCLDITEAVVDEAVSLGCNMIVSHHPLIFRPLRQVSDSTYQQRCVFKAVRNGITIYSAHTNLDNAYDGVNFKIASLLGIGNLEWLKENPSSGNVSSGSGVIGYLPEAEEPEEFLGRLKDIFKVECLQHSELPSRKISKVALCGGAGSFLMGEAIARGADCFITGEISYHHYFDADGMLLVAMGHYQSEQFTMDLLKDRILSCFPDMRVLKTKLNTNPIRYRL